MCCLFVEGMFDKAYHDMRAVLWRSENGFDWERVHTLKNSLFNKQFILLFSAQSVFQILEEMGPMFGGF